MDILEIVWNFEPRVIPAFKLPAWYGIMWALGFLVGYRIMDRMIRAENAPEEWMDKVLIYTMIGGILGARFGHVFFYDWASYSENPIEILYIWEGGLASHGGAIGIILAAFILSKYVIKKSVFWTLDRLVVPTAFAAFLIRIGNLFNHEIVGKPTGSDFGFKFLRNDIGGGAAMAETGKDNLHDAYSAIANDPQFSYILESIPNRYPAQFYEAICYILIFVVLFFLFWKTNASQLKGFLLGVFFVLLFTARFCIEFLKENQGGTDDAGFAAQYGINVGQMLSVPLVLIGLILIFKNIGSFKKGAVLEFKKAKK